MLKEILKIKNSVLFASPEYLYWGLAFFLISVSVIIFILGKLNSLELSYGSKRPLVGEIKFFGFFAVLVFIFSMIALARPYVEHVAPPLIKRGDVEIIFVVDNSGSMLVKDLGVSGGQRLARIDAAAREIFKLYSGGVIKEGDKIGAFVFGLTTRLKVYPTRDMQRFMNEISKLGSPEYLSGDASFWGSNLALVLESVYQGLDLYYRGENENKNWTPKPKANRLVIFFSDGDFDFLNPASNLQEIEERKAYQGRLVSALLEFRKRKLKIYSIGIGSRKETDLDTILRDYKKGDYGEKLEEEIKDLKTRLRLDGLEMIAGQTGGKTPIPTIQNAASGVTDILAKIIDSYRSMSIETPKEKERQELWQYALYIACLIIMKIGRA